MSSFIKEILGLDNPDYSNQDPNQHQVKGSNKKSSKKGTEAAKKIVGSEAVKKTLEDLVLTNENYKITCSDALETVYPLIQRVRDLASKNNSDANRQLTIELENALSKLDSIRSVMDRDEKAQVKHEKLLSKGTSESITKTKVSLLNLFKKLTELCEIKLNSSDYKYLEENKKYFDETVRDLQDPLRKMKDYLKSLKSCIDFLKSNPIPDTSVGPISQYLIFLDNELIENFNHEIKCQIGELTQVMGSDVGQHMQHILSKVKEWEIKNDELSSIIIQIENICRKIEWKIHLFQFLKTLKPEMIHLNKTVTELEGAITTQVHLLKKDRETSLEGARKAVDTFITSYEKSTKPNIEGVHARILMEIEILKEYLKKNSPEASHEILSQVYFYDIEVDKAHQEKIAIQLTETHKEITATLNELQVQWEEEFRPLNEKVVNQLNLLASSVLTKNGELRGGVWYAIKEVAGKNTKRVSMPNYGTTLG